MTYQGWRDARYELDRWAERGLTARFWVRDDDACEMSSNLARLHELAESYDLTIGLAVIPAKVEPSLLEFFNKENRRFHPMCHGWRHVNHAPPHKQPAEFGGNRPVATMYQEAELAFGKFSQHFTERCVIFVPPFGQISKEMIEALPGIGFAGLSGGPSWLEFKLLRLTDWRIRIPGVKVPKSSIPRLDVQIDPINWRQGAAHTVETICRTLTRCLRARRMGFLATDVPIGLVTHHQVHNESIWRVCGDILDVLRTHKAVNFLRVDQFFTSAGLPPN